MSDPERRARCAWPDARSRPARSPVSSPRSGRRRRMLVEDGVLVLVGGGLRIWRVEVEDVAGMPGDRRQRLFPQRLPAPPEDAAVDFPGDAPRARGRQVPPGTQVVPQPSRRHAVVVALRRRARVRSPQHRHRLQPQGGLHKEEQEQAAHRLRPLRRASEGVVQPRCLRCVEDSRDVSCRDLWNVWSRRLEEVQDVCLGQPVEELAISARAMTAPRSARSDAVTSNPCAFA